MDNTQTQGGALRPKAGYHRKGVVKSDLIAFVILLVFVAAVVAVDTLLKPALSGPLLMLAGLVLAVVPAAIWLFMFYQLDSAEPEPVTDVVKIFVVGLALAGAIGIPVTTEFFRVQEWVYRDTLTSLLGSVCVTGAVEAFIVFATVRFFMYDDPDFDERADGIIYGTAAGLGYATAINLQFILTNHGAALGPGEIYVAEVALAHAALGGLLGYFLGKCKMQHEPDWWLPLGFVLASLLGGLFLVLRGQFETGSISIGADAEFPSFTGLLLSGALAIIMSALAAFLVRRDVRLTLAGRMPPRAADADAHERQVNWYVGGTFALILLAGALVWNGAVNGTTSFNQDNVRGAYPAYFDVVQSKGDLLHLSDSLGSGAEFVITPSPAGAGQTVQDAATLLTADRGSRFAVYKTQSSKGQVSGLPALMQRFTYVDTGGLGRSAPQLKVGIDYIVVKEGRFIVITMITTPDHIQDITPLFTRFVNSLTL